MNKDTKTQSGYYPFQDGLQGDFYYLFISGEGKNVLKLPYTVRKGEAIRLKFAKPYATNNGTKNRSEVNNQLDLTVGSETYSLKNECDFDKWYTKDFIADSDMDSITITMGQWSAVAIESIEIIPEKSTEPTASPEATASPEPTASPESTVSPTPSGSDNVISDVSVSNNQVNIDFDCKDGILIIAGYDSDGVLTEMQILEKDKWQTDDEGYKATTKLTSSCENVKCFLWESIDRMMPLCSEKSCLVQ